MFFLKKVFKDTFSSAYLRKNTYFRNQETWCKNSRYYTQLFVDFILRQGTSSHFALCQL